MTGRASVQWLTARPVLVLAALPFMLLAFNDAWSWDSTAFFDNHVYLGFFRHYTEFTYPFTENYKSSRLPFLFPGVLLYRLLPDALAHQALFLVFLTGEAALLFVWARRRFGPHAAFAVAAAQVVFIFSHTGPSYHNQAASAYFVASLVLLDRPERCSPMARLVLAGGTFASAVTTSSIVAGLTPVFAFYALAAIPSPWTLIRIGRHALATFAGGVLALSVLGAINSALGGPFLFFLDQVHASWFLVEQKKLSSASLADVLLGVWRYPWLTIPLFACLASLAVLAVRVARLRIDQAALAAISFLVAIAVSALMHVRGLGLLEFPHLFHPFFAPMFLALAAILRPGLAREKPVASVALGAPFLAFAACLLLVPLSLLGGWISKSLILVGRAWPLAGNGSLIAFSLLVVAVPAAIGWRRSPAAVALVALGAFGLANAIATPPTQPAYLYDVRHPCSFRSDFFTALVEADGVLHAFDPDGYASWTFTQVRFVEPRFDGQGWCRQLPLSTVARDILLSRYFWTSVQFTNGYKMPGPLRKLVVSGDDAAQVDVKLAYFQAGQPANLRYTQRFSHEIARPTFSVLLRGYDVSPPP